MSWDAILQNCDGLDRLLFLRLAPLRTSLTGRRWNRWISQLADGPPYFLLAFLPFAWSSPNATGFLFTMAVGFSLELPAYKYIKRHFKRPRPCEALAGAQNLLPVPDTWSFPSGHTAGAFVLAANTLAFFPAAAPLAYAFALCVGYSRVYNRLHYPADTLAGAILGTACALAAQTLSGGLA